MSIFNKITASFTKGKLKKEQLDRMRESIWNAISDGVVSDQELQYINGYFSDSELTEDDFRTLKSEIYFQVVQRATADRRITENELQSLNHIANRLEIPQYVQDQVATQVNYFAEIARIEAGGPLSTGQPSGLILKKDEVCYLSLPADLIEERVVARNYSGRSHGVSIRLMKGVSYRVGQQRGQMVSQTGLVNISDGYFIITNMRLVFSGSRKSVATDLNKLLDLEVFADGLKIASTTRQKPTFIKFSRTEEAELAAIIISRILNEH